MELSCEDVRRPNEAPTTFTFRLDVEDISDGEEENQLYQVFVPRLVRRRPSPDVVYNVEDEDEDEDEGTDCCPHDLPVPVGAMADHVFYVLFKPSNEQITD